ncbi:MAG TPA: M20/M25/M40 family metallo-hydrolase [Solirubrobacteraceae bacterium]|jgi:Iap family predicted aminopeptidase|nr:M20/M25/M40 family metallo-hydrolase [Solirubrobacteraceae bacterium]
MRRPVALGLLAAALVAAAAPAAAPAQRIGAADVVEHLRALDGIARANGGNRAAGNPGEAATVDYVAARLREAGWNVDTPPVTFPYFAERAPPVVGALQPGRDAVTLRYSGSGDVTGRVLPLRFSGCSPRHFRGFPRGRIAMSLYGTCTFRRIAINAQRAGAAAVLFASGYVRRPPTTATMLGPGVTIPALALRDPPALRLARARATVNVRVDAFVEDRTGRNVVAELPGTTGRRVVMAGGHLDSVPEGPGLNDNGSGIAALIEIGERLAAAPRPPATLRLGFWTAEELNLNGSRAYVGALPPAERRRFAAYLNLDMVGSPNPVPEIYADHPRIRRALRRVLPRAGRTSVLAGSDHLPFRGAGIPVGGIFTGATERRRGRERDPCYHRPCDGLANVDAAMTARMAQAARVALARLAR